MARRIVVIEEHDFASPHRRMKPALPDCHICEGRGYTMGVSGSDAYTDACSCRFSEARPGGSRRVLNPGEFLLIEKVDGQWPTWAINNIVLTHALMHQPDRDFWWPKFLDALASGAQ